MNKADIWKEYVGERTTREFCERRQGRPIVAFVESQVARMPHFYGIVLRGTWRNTFARQPQYRREDVAAGLIGHLEACREEWENYAPEPPPQEVPAAREEAAAEVSAPPVEAGPPVEVGPPIENAPPVENAPPESGEGAPVESAPGTEPGPPPVSA